MRSFRLLNPTMHLTLAVFAAIAVLLLPAALGVW